MPTAPGYTLLENEWITLSDGCRLAARIWLPSAGTPAPAVLEYLPYRKRGGTEARDDQTFQFFAANGYAGVRVDMRGNGESDGLMLDEYLKQEQDDALETLAWIAAQHWCDGNIGMMGISWGGFNALQVAARRPPQLKAIITVCSTDDRYADDIHYKGGAMLMENAGWAATMFAFSSRPPDPQLAGDSWRKTWLRRLENMPPLLDNWMRHPNRDEFWKHGSVIENYADINIPVLAVGGWGDAYSNAVPRMVAGLHDAGVPVRGIMGPWLHKYPHLASPEPRIGFLEESVKWWDAWLKGADNGVMNAPLYAAYMMESARADATSAKRREGRWLAESQLPSPRVRPREFVIAGNALRADAEPQEGEAVVASPQHTGVAGGEYCAMSGVPDTPGDQRADDARSLVYDSAPLPARMEIFGAPLVRMRLRCDKPQAHVIVRLCDVHPDGASARISYGVLNLAHRAGFDAARPVKPGELCDIKIQLDDTAVALPPGHRLRLAFSSAYWPMLWPAPQAASLRIDCASLRLRVPLLEAENTGDECAFAEPGAPPPPDQEILSAPVNTRKYEYDFAADQCVFTVYDDFGAVRRPSNGLLTQLVARETYRIGASDPESCVAEFHWTARVERGDWKTRTETRTRLRAGGGDFVIETGSKAYEGGELVHEKTLRTTRKR